MFSQGGGITQTESEIDNQHRWFFLLIYTSVTHALFTRGRCLVPSKMTHDFRSPWSVTDVSPRRQAGTQNLRLQVWSTNHVLATDRHSDRCITTVGFPCTPRSASQRIICLQRGCWYRCRSPLPLPLASPSALPLQSSQLPFRCRGRCVAVAVAIVSVVA